MLRDLVAKNRSYRRFDESVQVPMEVLVELVDLARLSPSGANRQPLKYKLYNEQADREKIFPCLAWAGALPDWPGPAEGERPMGYVVILGDTEISQNFAVDEGIVAQSMMLGAVDHGFGGCMLGAINRKKLREALEIPERYEILLILALGRPAETVVIEDLEPGDNTNYWRDEEDVHHVPKRTLDELIV
ncbi:MAG: nitroreductase family protein [Anaerolineae bacterium]|nr:nitroreductase family protein [Anaerolineae bacterium]